MASGKRIPFINVLRLLAMVFVLTPHLLPISWKTK